MASSALTEPTLALSVSSIPSREEDEYATQHEENPLEFHSTTSTQHSLREDVRENAISVPIDVTELENDDPPPPYESMEDGPQATPIEYQQENSPQALVSPHADFQTFVEPIRRDALTSSSPAISPAQSQGSQTGSSSIGPFPQAQLTPSSTTIAGSIPTHSRNMTSSFSSAKAREAGFEIEPYPPQRTDSASSNTNITILPPTDSLNHTRQAGKLTAYLIPFPKPRIRGVREDEIPDRFLIYTPPLPPLSKPAPGEKESQWHKAKRSWQEDARKASFSQASMASWKGMKAMSTNLIGKGVSLTRSSTLDFLDRAADSEGPHPIEEPDVQIATEQAASSGPIPSQETQPNSEPVTPVCPAQSSPSNKAEDGTPKGPEELTLIYPPSLSLPPEKIRAEFVDSLLRTREKSRKDAVIASSLVPFAAAIDASLIVTLGGLTGVSGMWASSSIRGARASAKMTQGLEKAAQGVQIEEPEIRGCTCGHHTHDFGSPEIVPPKNKGKNKEKSINLRLQESSALEPLRQYLALACLDKEFNMFHHVQSTGNNVSEEMVLEAIGWKPTRRHGRDLEMENKDNVETLTPEQDELWQVKEARDDVKRYMKKGAAEWVAWCKEFKEDPRRRWRSRFGGKDIAPSAPNV